VKDLNPFWQAVLCAVLAILVMHCWSEEREQKPLDIATIKRTAQTTTLYCVRAEAFAMSAGRRACLKARNGNERS